MSIFERPRLFSQPVAKNERDFWPAWTDEPVILGPIIPPLPDVAPRWRSLAVTTRTTELDRIDGYGPAPLEELVRLAHEAHQAELDQAVADGESLAEFAAAVPDQVVWDSGRVVSVLRALPDGSLEDVRFARVGFLESLECSKGGAR